MEYICASSQSSMCPGSLECLTWRQWGMTPWRWSRTYLMSHELRREKKTWIVAITDGKVWNLCVSCWGHLRKCEWGLGGDLQTAFRWLIVGVVSWCRWPPLLLSWVICLFRPNCGHWHPQWQWWRTEDKRLKLNCNKSHESELNNKYQTQLTSFFFGAFLIHVNKCAASVETELPHDVQQ